jgi:hypothetical protein
MVNLNMLVGVFSEQRRTREAADLRSWWIDREVDILVDVWKE